MVKKSQMWPYLQSSIGQSWHGEDDLFSMWILGGEEQTQAYLDTHAIFIFNLETF